MKKFIKELFQDDVKEACIGRFSLFLGLVLTVFTATIDMDIEGEMSWAEATLRASPGIIGLIAYIFTRLYESKEFIAETSEKIIKAKK
ncbi:MAG: hypothetical protein UHM08_09105 [Bacteroidales bacterium]|nr:hypothetical protein [Bacteroidales bacterium]